MSKLIRLLTSFQYINMKEEKYIFNTTDHSTIFFSSATSLVVTTILVWELMEMIVKCRIQIDESMTPLKDMIIFLVVLFPLGLSGIIISRRLEIVSQIARQKLNVSILLTAVLMIQHLHKLIKANYLQIFLKDLTMPIRTTAKSTPIVQETFIYFLAIIIGILATIIVLIHRIGMLMISHLNQNL